MSKVRDFQDLPAQRQHVPLLIGLAGPSGSGKTFSALRLATGIQKVTGGDIFAIDTEADRMLHYADMFKFRHVTFRAPFGSLDYLQALEFCAGRGAKVIIVDSMSHEHEGPGGLLDMQLQELDRLAGNDWAKRERMNMLAWQKPKAARRAMLNGLLQINANFIFCFRAKNTSKPGKGPDGKMVILPMGYMPIAGEELIFEMTVACLLLPGAQGAPIWHSDNIGEKAMMKLPQQFRNGWFKEGEQLSEGLGERLAQWAAGNQITAPGNSPTRIDDEAQKSGEENTPAPEEPPHRIDPLKIQQGAAWAADRGTEFFRTYYRQLGKEAKACLTPYIEKLKAAAAAADKSLAERPDDAHSGAQAGEDMFPADDASEGAVARHAGRVAKVQGMLRRAVPGEYRDKPELAKAWQDGWDETDQPGANP